MILLTPFHFLKVTLHYVSLSLIGSVERFDDAPPLSTKLIYLCVKLSYWHRVDLAYYFYEEHT